MTAQPLLDSDPGPSSDGDAATATRRPVRIPHAPGLDGLRGLAVAAVVVFHAGPPGWLPGGFLGVSLFFTLSGYLITTLVLEEIRRDRSVSLGGFWGRRMRRLVPALVATLLAVMVAAQFMDFGGDLRADLLGGVTYTSNWVLIAQGQSYAELFLAPSPLQHLWSLAIEEQFYVLLPLVAWALSRWAPWRIRTNLAVGAGLIVAAGVAWCQLADDPDISYYGTLNRAPEIAIGVLLACRTQVSRERAPSWLTGLSIPAALITLVLWRTAGVTDGWIVGGGLAAFALCSAVLVFAGTRPGPVSNVLSFAPFRGLGLISYGLYLIHWPVVVILSYPRVDLGDVPLFFLRVGVALALALVSYRFLEQPLRRGRLDLPDRTTIGIGLGALAVTGLLALVAIPASSSEETAASEPAPAVIDPRSTTQPEGSTTVPADVGPPTMVLLGDSLPAWMVRDGGSVLDPEQVTLVNATLEACDGTATGRRARGVTGADVPVPEGCNGWPDQYPPFFEQDADLAVLMVGGHAVLDHELDGEWYAPCQPEAQTWYGDDIRHRVEYLSQHVDTVVVVLPAWADKLSRWINPPDYLDRMDCVRATMSEAAAEGGAEVIDFGRYVCPDGREPCRPLRTGDGMHLDPPNAGEALQWVVDESLRVADADADGPTTTAPAGD